MSTQEFHDQLDRIRDTLKEEGWTLNTVGQYAESYRRDDQIVRLMWADNELEVYRRIAAAKWDSRELRQTNEWAFTGVCAALTA